MRSTGEVQEAALRSLQRLAAYGLVINGAGRVLLTRDPDSPGHADRWLLPGGGVEHGEHPEQTVIREAMEETGLRVCVAGLQHVITDVARVGRRRRALHNVRLIYRATVQPGQPGQQLSGNARWCSAPEWRTLPLAPFAARVLQTSWPGDS